MLSRAHVTGFLVGLASVWAWHHFVKPLPGAKTG